MPNCPNFANPNMLFDRNNFQVGNVPEPRTFTNSKLMVHNYPSISSTFNTPKIPSIPNVPNVPKIPNPQVPPIPRYPVNLPDLPKIPEIPKIPKVANMDVIPKPVMEVVPPINYGIVQPSNQQVLNTNPHYQIPPCGCDYTCDCGCQMQPCPCCNGPCPTCPKESDFPLWLLH